MRIVYLSSPDFADCDFPLIKEFQKQGHEVYFFLDLPPYKLKSTLINIKTQIKEDSILKASRYKEFEVYKTYMSMDKVFIINRTKKSMLWPKNLLLYLKIAYTIKKINPDTINVVAGINLLSSILLLFRKKMVLTVHDPFPHTGEKGLRREFFRVLAMKFIPKFILLNEKQKNKFINQYGLQDNQVFINRLGVYDCISNFINKAPKTTENKNVLFFGRISPYKGIEYLLEAMKYVHERMPDATLTIAGSGKFYFDVSPYENFPYIEILNRYIDTSELAMLVNKARIVVCPYTDATQSGVVMTAYSLCKPVIATDVGGMRETVIDGKTGILVSPKDSKGLANSMIDLLGNEKKLNDMVKYIKDYFFQHYNWEKIADKYLEIYKSQVF